MHTSTRTMARRFTSFFLVVVQLWLLQLLPGSNADYNVVSFGANADGRTDSAAAFVKAWEAACSSASPAAVYVPDGRFLVSQAIFSGPCRSTGIRFRIDGTVIAPSDYNSDGASSGEWIGFHDVEGVSIVGGNLDGRGQALWACKLAGGTCPSGASSLTFRNSKKIEIRGLRSSNSKLFHIVILECDDVSVRGVNIAAAGNSPNTDGFHVQQSTGVNIVNSAIRTGDDCVSVGPGTAHLWIERVYCGPGHGISIGSLGKKQQAVAGREEGVRNVTVRTVIFSGTQNGVRIKTWGTNIIGYVTGVTFRDVVMRDVQNPIIIDQNYCPGNKGCPGQSSNIKISEIKYANIRGTSATSVAVRFDCSPSNPCSGIWLHDIDLSYQNSGASSSCSHARGLASGLLVPPSCL